MADTLPQEFSSPLWRLRNIYTIVDRNARETAFRCNPAQDDFLKKMHTRNVLLKARQRGFSTLVQLAALDQCLFNENFAAGIIAHTLDDSAAFLKRIMFAYSKLPTAITSRVRVTSRNTSMVEFSNGSSIKVDTSMRSGTLQFLHISEFAKICAKYPDKADEVMSGSLPAVSPDGMVFIESTAEGRDGHFYRICQQAEQQALRGDKLSKLDFKYHFYGWQDEAAYVVDPDTVTLSRADEDYFDALELSQKIILPPEKRAWYVAQKARLGDELMLREFPSTGEEAFRQSTQGRYYHTQLAAAFKEQRIGNMPWIQNQPVHTFWDIGANDETAIWLMQEVGQRYRFIRYYEASGEPFAHFVAWLQNTGCVWGYHYLPHDADNKRQQGLRNLSSIEMLEELAPGWRFEVVPRIDNVITGIQQTRDWFGRAEFDEAGCKQGLLHLENYRKEWNDRLGVWRDTPRHDQASNGADAFRQWAQVYAAKAEAREFKRPRRDSNWRVL